MEAYQNIKYVHILYLYNTGGHTGSICDGYIDSEWSGVVVSGWLGVLCFGVGTT